MSRDQCRFQRCYVGLMVSVRRHSRCSSVHHYPRLTYSRRSGLNLDLKSKSKAIHNGFESSASTVGISPLVLRSLSTSAHISLYLLKLTRQRSLGPACVGYRGRLNRELDQQTGIYGQALLLATVPPVWTMSVPANVELLHFAIQVLIHG